MLYRVKLDSVAINRIYGAGVELGTESTGQLLGLQFFILLLKVIRLSEFFILTILCLSCKQPY